MIGVEKAINENNFLEPQLGKAFDKESELEKVAELISQLETQMKDELAAIEVAEADENIEAIDFNSDDEFGSDEDILLREGEDYTSESLDIPENKNNFVKNDSD